MDSAPGVVETSDGKHVRVLFNPGTQLSSYIEVIGTVQPDCSIQEELLVQLGETFHLKNYEELLQLSCLLPGPFSQAEN